jgi:hypoxanthine-DNA glycosylase
MADIHSISSPVAISAGFLPVTGDTPRVLILGSFPGVRSLRHSEYYGNKQNHFWKIMEALFALDHRHPYRDRIASLTRHHIALWDVVRTCKREGSLDQEIRNPVFNDISGFITTHPTIRLTVLNGTAAGRYYSRLHISPAIENRILPSTSPANTRYTLAEKVSAWEIVRASCEGGE